MTSTNPKLQGLETATEVLVKSRDRVKVYGEVFTPHSMVQQMLDLVAPESKSIDTTFFEPASGDGNFLIAILRRKLMAVESLCEPSTWATESLFALASIYGVELLADNHEAAQAGMLAEFKRFHTSLGVACTPQTNLWQAANHLVRSNVLRGNTLTGKNAAGEEMQFFWWHRVSASPGEVQAESFTLASLREANAGMFDFSVAPPFPSCAIDRVHLEVRGNA